MPPQLEPADPAAADRAGDLEATLREVVHTLARLERRAGSPGELAAARWLADRLSATGAHTELDEVDFLDGYAGMLLPLGGVGLTAAALALKGRSRLAAAALAASAAAAIIDDVSNGKRVWRRLVGRRKRTSNVVAWVGDPDAASTLVVLAHHDAAPTGVVFEQGLQRWLARRHPRVIARTDTSPPIWWPTVAGPILVTLGALLGSRRLTATGGALGMVVVALGLDVARNRVVPGANDNLSATAALVGVAERLHPSPPPGLRVMLVSCGAEEVLQGGIYPFVDRHLSRLDRGRTWVINLETIGSPALVLVEGEGPFRMEDYCDPSFRELIAEVAERTGRPIRRGVRLRASSDAVVPSRAGYPTATIASWEPDTKLASNYHLMSDTPERLRFETVGHAVELVCGVADALADPER